MQSSQSGSTLRILSLRKNKRGKEKINLTLEELFCFSFISPLFLLYFSFISPLFLLYISLLYFSAFINFLFLYTPFIFDLGHVTDLLCYVSFLIQKFKPSIRLQNGHQAQYTNPPTLSQPDYKKTAG